jgi:energy-coupling factor transport system permease protein
VSVRLSFIAGSSFIHKLDPRTKLMLWVAIAAPAIVLNSILVSLAAFSLTVIIAIFGRVGTSYVKNLMKVVVPVFIPIFLIQGLFNPAGKTPVLFILPWLYFKREGLVFAGVLLARLLAIFGGGYLLTLTTRPGDLMTSMQKLGLPLKIAYPLFSAFQIVPTIDSRLESVKQAQMSRGLELEKINMLQKLRTYVPLITPLLMGAIEEAYRRSIALEARGFSSRIEKTFLMDVRMRKSDFLFIGATVFALGLLTSMIMTLVPQPNPWNL